MGKINIKDSGKFQSTGGDYFVLKDDGDVATVRFLYDQPDGSDVDYYLVHQVEIDGKKRYVNCNAVDDDGKMHTDDCPLCKAGNKPREKLFLQLYDQVEGKIKVWERGQTFVSKLVTYLNRYKSLDAQDFEIERRGKKGDTNTTYELFPCEKDNKTLADFPEKIDIIGSFILQVSKQDMYDIIDGIYKPVGAKQDKQEAPPRRDSKADRNTRDTGTRRSRGNSDAF